MCPSCSASLIVRVFPALLAARPKLHPDDLRTARSFLAAFEPHLNGACVGSISEVFDAEPPFVPRGCVAQAWSIAEVLRAWVKTEPPENG